MASGKEIRSKIKSVQNTQKITKAMEMVAASKMRKAQDRMQASRPYAEKMRDVLSHLAQAHCEYKHPYLQDREEARDAVMQIFEKLITELPRHRVKTFQSWLYVLTKNHCLMALRARKKEEKNLEGLKIEHDFLESGEALHPVDRDDPSLEEALKECIDQLKDEQKGCIEMFYYQQRSYQEIAEALKIDEKKVKSHLQNGKRNLKICLERKNVR